MDEKSNDNPALDHPGRDWFWLASCTVITVLATVLRFADLALKPLHHDEGVNGFFLTNLFRNGDYKYDPANYHGPTLYYIALVFAKLFGLETVPVRESVAIWGVGIVILCFYLRPYIGKAGSLFAGLFVALSPGMVFISRYFIHEIFFVFLSLAIVISVAYFIEKRPAGAVALIWISIILLTCLLPSTLTLSAKAAGEDPTTLWLMRALFFVVEAVLVFFLVRIIVTWNEGRPVYFLLAASCLALLFATKETAFITVGTMIIACVCVSIWLKIKSPGWYGDTTDIEDHALSWKNFTAAFGSGADSMVLVIAGVGLAVYLTVVFFSSFFTFEKSSVWLSVKDGIAGFFDAYTIWSKTGSKDHTQNGIWAYFRWGMRMEAPVFILSALGTLIAFVKARHRFAIFTGLWAVGLLTAYTLIPYKTPWLDLSFLLPMCIISGYAIGQVVEGSSIQLRVAALGLGIAAAVVMAYQSYELNFVHYDDNDMPYVYAHTYRDFNGLIAAIDHYAKKSGQGRDAKIEIVSPDYWPMVWYVKDYTHADFWGHIIDLDCSSINTCPEMIVAKKNEQDAEVIRKYSARYEYAGSWGLRPGVELELLVRRDLAEPGAEDLYKILQEK